MAKKLLFIHTSSGQWAKKIKGRQYYFGSVRADPEGKIALADYLARKEGILTGLDRVRVDSTCGDLLLGDFTKQFASVVAARLNEGKLADETFVDYKREVTELVNFCGPQAVVKALGPAHFSKYYTHLTTIRKLGPHRLATTIRYIKAMFNWGVKNGLISSLLYGSEFVPPATDPESIAVRKSRNGEEAEEEDLFLPEHIYWLLNRATPQFKAMILLSLNCGMGPSDLARLKWKHVNFKTGRLNLRRGKNGIKREAYLWRQTREAIIQCRRLKHNRHAFLRDRENAYCFLTRTNQPFVRRERIENDGKISKIKVDNAISRTFSRWVAEAREAKVIVTKAKLTYYTLRSTYCTHADNCPDSNAFNRTMGRAIVGSNRRYIRGPMKMKRLKRVAMVVKHQIFPRQTDQTGPSKPASSGVLKSGQMRLVS